MLANAQRTFTLAGLTLATAVSLAGAPAATTTRPSSPALERFKALAGDWVSADDNEMAKKGDLVARYTVTGAGSAVVETIFPGSPHEMVTVYHADGPDLVLTHYCTEGNQPRMRARDVTGTRFDFAFDGGANIDPQHDRHMHSASVELVSADEIRSAWNELADGKPVFTANVHLLRKR
jgi:hypothetical protein